MNFSTANQSWPYLVGRPVSQAVTMIRSQNPRLDVIPVPEGSPVTYDLQSSRVRVFYNRRGLVSSVPSIG